MRNLIDLTIVIITTLPLLYIEAIDIPTAATGNKPSIITQSTMKLPTLTTASSNSIKHEGRFQLTWLFLLMTL